MQKYIIAILGTVVLASCGSVSVDDDWDADVDVEGDIEDDVPADESEADEADVVLPDAPDAPDAIEEDAAVDEDGSNEADVVLPDDVVEPDDAGTPEDADVAEEIDVAPVCPDDMDCTGLACGPDPVCGESCGSCGYIEFCAAGVCTCRNGDVRGCTSDFRSITVCIDGAWVTHPCDATCPGIPSARCCHSSYDGSYWCTCDGYCG